MERNNSGFWKGFLMGAAIGAGVGLLMAPMPGVETRARLKDTLSKGGSRMQYSSSELQGTVQSAASRTRGYFHDLRSRMSAAVKAGTEAAREKRMELQTEIESVTKPKQGV